MMRNSRAAVVAAVVLAACGGAPEDSPAPESPSETVAEAPTLPSAEQTPGGSGARVRSWELPSAPMDIELVSEELAYVSLADGRILAIQPPSHDASSLAEREVLDGLALPRGLAAADGYLYVAELGPMPCEPPYPYCFGGAVGPTRIEGERTILEQSSGSVARYRIGADGALDAREEIIGGLPASNTEHGVNDLEVGPDGSLYLSIGHVERLFFDLELLREVLHPRTDWLGTVLRIDPVTRDASVFASGMRNVYGIAFDEEGRLFGVDNDGPAGTGFRQEELLEIFDGATFGFPEEGSRGPSRDPATAIMPTVGSGGISATGADRLLIGGCNGLYAVPLMEIGDSVMLADRPGLVAAINGCISTIASVGAGALLGVFTTNELLLVRLAD